MIKSTTALKMLDQLDRFTSVEHPKGCLGQTLEVHQAVETLRLYTMAKQRK